MVTVENYGGFWAVDYISDSLACTLYVTEIEGDAWDKYDRFSTMTDRQLENYLLVG